VNKINRRLIACIVILANLLNSVPVRAQTNTSACSTPGGIQFGFFNGVKTTKDEADRALNTLEQIYGTKTPADETITYQVFYNHTNGIEDFVETFEQRMAEQASELKDRFELFNEAVRGSGRWIDSIKSAVPAYVGAFDGVLQLFQAFVVRVLTGWIAKPPTFTDYAKHRNQIDSVTQEGKKLLLFAHSQGNLFANKAFDYTRTKVGANSVKLVHAAPASVLLNGEHTLADLDVVINALRITGSVAGNTDTIPLPGLREAGLGKGKDALGHGLLEIYLNKSLDTSKRLKAQVETAFTSLVSPPQKLVPGYLTATLTWDGIGDVDLHTYEPSGRHVYFDSPVGAAGELDEDNTVANGPEHYYASCDTNKLQTGVYQFAVANYSGALGRKAMVHLVSASDGVLDTRSVILGAETDIVPSATLFRVQVSKNPTTGKYSSRLLN
jgi:hypothetical protein